MEKHITREAALLKKYNKDPFHLRHALTVEGVMRWYARQLGFAEEEDFGGIVGLLHDLAAATCWQAASTAGISAPGAAFPATISRRASAAPAT